MTYFMLHKPAGPVCARTDPEKPTVMDLLPDKSLFGGNLAVKGYRGVKDIISVYLQKAGNIPGDRVPDCGDIIGRSHAEVLSCPRTPETRGAAHKCFT